MTAIDMTQAIEDFWAARQKGGRYPLWWQHKLGEREGYGVQLALLERHAACGQNQAGWKVGVTARAIREQFGLPEPVFACLFQHARWSSGGTWPLADLYLPGWENELCLIAGERLAGPDITPARAAKAIARLAPALEIIETRGPNTHEGMHLMLADNGQQRAFVTATEVPFDPALDLGRASVEIFIDGVSQEKAFGSAVMDSGPLASVAWLANKLAAFGRAIEPGHAIMTGSFTRQYQLDRPMAIEARFDPIGSATARFVCSAGAICETSPTAARRTAGGTPARTGRDG